MKPIFLFFLIITFKANAQYKSFLLLDNGDTLNRVDNKNMKQGRWKIHINALRLEPAMDEEGNFIDNKKEGVWRRYDSYGLLVAKEYYRWDNKDGLQQYLDQGRLEHEEGWRSIDPKQQFDTIDVHDVIDEYKVERKIIKIESYSVQQGRWTWYDPETGRVLRTENYMFGKLVVPVKKEIAVATDTLPKPKVKPKEILEFEKKNSKKTFKVRGGSTGY